MNAGRWFAAVGVVALTAAGCSGDDDAAPTTVAAEAVTTTTTATPSPPFPVVTENVTLVDDTRPTPESTQAGVAAADSRTLETTLTYPDAAGEFPLIAFAHGYAGHPRKFSQLFEAWAEAGFVVVAPAFPLSNDTVPGAPDAADLPNQPGDLSFTIDEALRMNGEAGQPLQGRVNPEQIGVAGLSLGGATVYGVAFNDCCTDPRLDAAVVMDGAQLAVGGEAELDNGTPLLIYHADGDPVIPIAAAEEAFALASPPKYLVTIHEDIHPQPYEDQPDPADELVIDSSIAFWRQYLEHDGTAGADFSTAARVDGLTTVVEQPG